MVQGNGAGHRTARRARRLTRWWGADARTSDVPRARAGADAPDTWFDDWLTGHPAESAGTGHELARVAGTGWVTLTGLNRPGSTRATVEHVAVGPGGIVVVETLHWDGEIEVAGGTLRHRGYGRTPDVAEVAGAAGALTALLAPTHRRTVLAVLCLADRDLDPVAVCGGAVAVGERQLADYLTALPERLVAADVPLVVDYLTAELTGTASPELLTVDDVFRPAAVWDAPTVPAAAPSRAALPADAPAEAHRDPSGDAPGYDQPHNIHPEGHPDQAVDRPAPSVAPDRRRPAVGDGALRLGVLVLGLLTVGNVLLAWLDATH